MKFFLVLFLSIFSMSVLAGEGEISTVLAIIGPFLSSYVEKYPLIGDIIGVMVTARLVIKPLMSALLTIFEDTQFSFLQWAKDVSDSKVYKSVAFVLDWLLSIKLPKKEVVK